MGSETKVLEVPAVNSYRYSRVINCPHLFLSNRVLVAFFDFASLEAGIEWGLSIEMFPVCVRRARD